MLPGAAQDPLDPIVAFQHELNYIDLVTNVGSSEFLTVPQVEDYGQCDFTTEEILRGAFALYNVQPPGDRRPS
jgi:hypothetical protein